MHGINNLPAVILIGRQTETGVEEIAFDCSGWLEKWPGMQISILAMRPGEADAYPAAIRKEGAVVVWEVNASDTAIAGDGYAELIGLVDGKRKLSRTINTRIVSIKSNVVSEVPEAAKPWVNEVLEAARRAEDAAERAEDAEAGLFQEDDPTVPAWAKQPEKPKYTADEVGAQPKGDYALRSEIPTVPVKSVNGKTGAVQLSAGDIGAADASQTKLDIEKLEADIANKQPKGNYLTAEADPTVPTWAKQPNKPTYTAEEVGAQPKGNYALKSEIPSVPVQSVNGKTGAVQLSASDVGAASKAEVERLSEEKADKFTVGEGLQMDGDVLNAVSGGNYELIETFAPNEDMALKRTQHPDGTPYKLTALALVLMKPADLVISSSISHNVITTTGRTINYYVSGESKTSELYQYAEAYLDHGLWKKRRRYIWETRNNMVYTQENSAEFIVAEQGEYIKEISSTKPLPAGLVVEIWGVRA